MWKLYQPAHRREAAEGEEGEEGEKKKAVLRTNRGKERCASGQFTRQEEPIVGLKSVSEVGFEPTPPSGDQKSLNAQEGVEP